MLKKYQLSFVKALCFIWLSWSCAAWAISLGSPQLQSKAGEPLRVEIPIRVMVKSERKTSLDYKVLPTTIGRPEGVIDVDTVQPRLNHGLLKSEWIYWPD